MSIRHLVALTLVLGLAILTPVTARQRTHRLEATPSTVAYGYYWSEATPVLRIASGDIIDVDTLLTNTPNGLQRAGIAPERIQASRSEERRVGKEGRSRRSESR